MRSYLPSGKTCNTSSGLVDFCLCETEPKLFVALTHVWIATHAVVDTNGDQARESRRQDVTSVKNGDSRCNFLSGVENRQDVQGAGLVLRVVVSQGYIDRRMQMCALNCEDHLRRTAPR